MKVSQTKSDKYRKTLTYTTEDGETMDVTYDPSVLTPNAIKALANENDATVLASLLSVMILDWDLFNDDGSKYPLEEEAVGDLPLAFLADLFGQIQKDAEPSGEASASSDAG